MPIITGGNIIRGGKVIEGVRQPMARVTGVPTDTSTGTPTNGAIAEDLNTGNLYERQAGVWVRIDTL
jgi:hypothetical protein